MVVTRYQIVMVVLYTPLRLSPTSPDSDLATALVKLQFSVNWLLTG